jgi:replicative DNA helicase
MSAGNDVKPLPWSPEAEQSVLGALMLDPTALLRISDRQLQAAHFFDQRHRAVWAAAVDLSARSQPIDVVTVFERLRDLGKTDDFGDSGCLAYLNALAACVPSATNIGRHADIVVEKALRRAMVAAADQARDLAHSAGETDAVLDRVASLFAGIKRSAAAGAPRRLGGLVSARLAHWQALEAGDTVSGISTGLEHLDTALGGGLKPGKVIVLAARPSVGKTSLAGQIGLSVAGQGHSVLMLSQEMPAGDLVDRAIANLGGVRLDRITTGAFEQGDWGRMLDATDAAAALPFFVDDQPALSLLDIRAKAREVLQRDGLAVLLVDYLQLCASTISAERRHHQIEQISRGMKTLAKELGVCVILLSQLKRDDRREPELEHLKESGAIEEDADTVILLHPVRKAADESLIVLAKIPKNRQGRRGRLALAFQGATQRWECSTADVSRASTSDA